MYLSEKKDTKSEKKQRNNDGPPDLDQVWQDLQNNLRSILGGKAKKGAGLPPQGGRPNHKNHRRTTFKLLSTIVILLLLMWAASGIFTVKEGDQAVITRLGKYHKTVGSGYHWHYPTPLGADAIIRNENLNTIRSVSGSNHVLISADHRLFTIDALANLRLKTAEELQHANIETPSAAASYLFHSVSPSLAAERTLNSVLQNVVAHSTSQELTAIKLPADPYDEEEGLAPHETQTAGAPAESDHSRATPPDSSDTVVQNDPFVQQLQQHLQAELDKQQLGLQVVKVEVTLLAPFKPQAKQAATPQDTPKEPEVAAAPPTNRIAQAQKQAKAILLQAEKDSHQAIDKAALETADFEQQLQVYRKAPELMRQKMYDDTMQEVISKAQAVVVNDSQNPHNGITVNIASNAVAPAGTAQSTAQRQAEPGAESPQASENQTDPSAAPNPEDVESDDVTDENPRSRSLSRHRDAALKARHEQE
ncbi:protease modulator HflK [Brackiella oedipodis]|uniref:protease modulator HflK n=1 Tax=Brackiella oedipodis TaxID=124225 RepID=UPI00146FA008|nr:protease modulator HflK [Brackiella oedipodis]